MSKILRLNKGFPQKNSAIQISTSLDTVGSPMERRPSMIGSLMYLTASRPDIMFAGFSFELVAYTDSDYAGATLDRKSTTRGCQFLGNRLISWQCKKQTVVATSTTKAEYVAAASCCGQKGVGDEAVHKELGDRMERVATTASSLEAKQDSGLRLHLNSPLIYLSQEVTHLEVERTATAKVQTVNGVRQLQALVDKKRVIVTESSIRRDLHLDDAEVLMSTNLTATIF
ncbi:hypothetical protein Tco_1255734 [Tanacetum coccineum]